MAVTINQKEPNIRKIYNPDEAELKVLHHVYNRKQEMGDKRAELEPDWDKWEKQWNAYRSPKDANDWKSNIYIPVSTSVIESQLSEIVNQEMMPWVVARGSEDEPKAMVMNAILAYTWEVSKSNVALFQMVKDALIYGTGIGMEYYWKEPRTIKNKQGKDEQILEFDDTYLMPIRLNDFYVDERARSFTGPCGAKDAIWRNIMDYDDFRSFFTGKVWDPFNQSSLVKPGGDTNYYEFYKPPERIDQSREVEVLWYWNKPDDKFIVVANDIVIRNEANPYKHKQLPFVRVIDVLRPYQFYGKGECELMESLQEETNTLRRMIIDRNHLDIDKPILTSDSMTLEDEDAMAAPHRIIPVGDVTQIKFPEYSDIARSVFDTLGMLNDDRIRVTGMDERQQSVSTAGTATEAAILKEATLKRLNMKVWQIKNDTLVDVGRIRVANIMQFYSQPKLEAIAGEEMVAKAKAEGSLTFSDGQPMKKTYRNIRLENQKIEIDPRTNQPKMSPSRGISFFKAEPKFFLPSYGSYDVRYKASSTLPISKPLMQQKADEMYDRLSTNPTVDPWKLAEFLLESRELNPDDFKVKKPGEDVPKGIPLQQMIDLASIENDQMLRGNEIAPTAYASAVHTQIHVDFMNSKRFKEDIPAEDQKIIQLFTNHVMGEIAAQQARGTTGQTGGGMGQGQPGGEMGQPSGITPPSEGGMSETVPGRIEGGDQVPSGMDGANSGVQVGRNV